MRKKIAALAIAGGALMALVVPVSSAQAAPSGQCDRWSDSNTFGAGRCNLAGTGSWVRAVATCNNGAVVVGAEVPATSMSYVYCAGKGGLRPGSGAYFTR
ncbi:hypothetical protein P9869_39470 [Streptomyces ossamyceticus]|nr:hypothetical protein [Streptomyces ossamyceticus]